MIRPLDLSPRGFLPVRPISPAETDPLRAVQHGASWCPPEFQADLGRALAEASRVAGLLRTHREADRVLAWLGHEGYGPLTSKRLTVECLLVEAWFPHRIVR